MSKWEFHPYYIYYFWFETLLLQSLNAVSDFVFYQSVVDKDLGPHSADIKAVLLLTAIVGVVIHVYCGIKRYLQKEWLLELWIGRPVEKKKDAQLVYALHRFEKFILPVNLKEGPNVVAVLLASNAMNESLTYEGAISILVSMLTIWFSFWALLANKDKMVVWPGKRTIEYNGLRIYKRMESRLSKYGIYSKVVAFGSISNSAWTVALFFVFLFSSSTQDAMSSSGTIGLVLYIFFYIMTIGSFCFVPIFTIAYFELLLVGSIFYPLKFVFTCFDKVMRFFVAASDESGDEQGSSVPENPMHESETAQVIEETEKVVAKTETAVSAGIELFKAW